MQSRAYDLVTEHTGGLPQRIQIVVKHPHRGPQPQSIVGGRYGPHA